jgi:uncharacterized protein (TIGR01777 family)
MAKILISGGSGLLGQSISGHLKKQGDEVAWLSRESGTVNGIKKYRWDPDKNEIDLNAFENVEQLVHLAGAGIFDKAWTKSYKQQIIDSRVKSSELLVNTIQKNNFRIKTLVGTSASGYYGADTGEKIITEKDPAGNDFLSKVCVDWEQSYKAFERLGIRTVILRLGIILSSKGGYYERMQKIRKFGLVPVMGPGSQKVPWVHVEDAARAYVYAISNAAMSGSYNLVASQMVSAKNLSANIAGAKSKAILTPLTPAFVLKLAMGEKAASLTGSQMISNRKLKDAGFQFTYDSIESAVRELR